MIENIPQWTRRAYVRPSKLRVIGGTFGHWGNWAVLKYILEEWRALR